MRATRRRRRRHRGPHQGARQRARPRRTSSRLEHGVKDLVVGSDLDFDDRGPHELRGVPGEWRLYAVSNKAHVAAQ
jgi:hypothetical protein